MKAIDFTKLTRDNIVDLLAANDYNDNNDIENVEFMSVSNGQVRYKIEYYDFDELQEGFVFVYIDNDGKLVADY